MSRWYRRCLSRFGYESYLAGGRCQRSIIGSAAQISHGRESQFGHDFSYPERLVRDAQLPIVGSHLKGLGPWFSGIQNMDMTRVCIRFAFYARNMLFIKKIMFISAQHEILKAHKSKLSRDSVFFSGSD